MGNFFHLFDRPNADDDNNHTGHRMDEDEARVAENQAREDGHKVERMDDDDEGNVSRTIYEKNEDGDWEPARYRPGK